MSYFEDQMDAWFENDCQGSIEDTDPYSDDSLESTCKDPGLCPGKANGFGKRKKNCGKP